MNNEKLLDLVNQSNSRVHQTDHFCYYEVDGFKIDNKHLVSWYEKTYNTTATFVYRDLDIIKQNLKKCVIDLNYDYNAEFIKHLRSKYKKVNLFYSGGADSETILNTAQKIDFRFDETITLVVDNIDLPCNIEVKELALRGLEKYKKNIKKPSIIAYTFDDVEKYFANEYSYFAGPCDAMVPLGFGAAKYSSLQQYFHHKDSCFIKGNDKPQIVYYNNKWYATMIDSDIDGDQCIPNVVYFWLDADNIKSYIKESILYRDYIIQTNFDNTKSLQFFKPSSDPASNSVINRVCVDNWKIQFKKSDSKLNHKSQQRLTDALSNNRYNLLVNYFSSYKMFNSIFPETVYPEGLENYHQQGKFAWFIDLDSLQVYTQNELIPNGF